MLEAAGFLFSAFLTGAFLAGAAFWVFASFIKLDSTPDILDYIPEQHEKDQIHVWYTTHPKGGLNKEGNVFGLMPHPERAIEFVLGSEDGIRMLKGFESA